MTFTLSTLPDLRNKNIEISTIKYKYLAYPILKVPIITEHSFFEIHEKIRNFRTMTFCRQLTPPKNSQEIFKTFLDNFSVVYDKTFGMNSNITYKEIFKFYLPLVFNAQMMFLSAPVINLCLSRTANPEVAIAAYSVGFSFMVFLNSPSIASRNISTALTKDQTSFAFIRKIFLSCGALVTLTAATIALSPLHNYVFQNILAIPPDIEQEVQRVLLIISPIGFIVSIRGVYQGVALIHKKTSILAYATFVRLSSVGSITFLTAFWLDLPGAQPGAYGILGGMGMEALFVYLQTRKFFHTEFNVQTSQAEKTPLKFTDVVHFALPILIGMYILTLLPSIVNGIISRTDEPEMALAGFGVIYSIMRFFTSPLFGFQITTLVLYKSYQDLKKLTVSVLGLALLFCLTLLGVAESPLGTYLLTDVFALDPALLTYTYPGFLVSTVFPVFSGLRSHTQGVLMNLHKTNAMSISALSKIPLIFAVGFTLLLMFPHINGVALGIVLITLGEFCDDVIMGGVSISASRKKALTVREEAQSTPKMS